MATKNILITGASGLIGQRLTELLLQKGYHVSHLGRKSREGKIPSYVWDIEQGIVDGRAFQNIDSVIHLAGAGVADKPWTQKRKHEILESRTKSTQLLFRELSKNKHSIKSFISASAIGYYGFGDSEEVFVEENEAGTDFLASVTSQWETEVDKLNELYLRVVKVRIGIVLSDKGGALKPMILPIKLFAGSPLGSGKQYMSWIHIDDLCRLFIHAVENESMAGAYNAVAPVPVTNKEFIKTISKVVERPLWLPNVPGFVLKLLLGEMAGLILNGSRIDSSKIQKTAFQFQYPILDDALRNLLKPQ